MALTKQQILGAADLKTEMVDVPEWGGQVRIRVMTGRARGEWDSMIAMRDRDGRVVDQKLLHSTLVALCLCDENGNRLFDKPDEIKQLDEKSADALTRVFVAAAKLNGIGVGAVDDAGKNSEPTTP